MSSALTATAAASVPTAPESIASAPPSAASGSQSAEPTLKGFAALQAAYPAESNWPSGKGVYCLDKTCGPNEFCCMAANGGFCMAKGTEDQCTAIDVYCDESSDCPGAERCCVGNRDDDRLAECASAARCARFWDSPGRLMIPAHELCGRGGSCKDPLKTCVTEKMGDSVSGGRCLFTKSRVRCGEESCPSKEPWCYWDPETQSGECIPRGPWYGEDGVFECDEPSDCPGQYCCGSLRWSMCGTAECEPALAYGFMLCKTSKDCVVFEGKQGRCEPQPELPGGTGACSWAY
ncbi:MAG: hypothetical protein U0271_07025 [Polyangiaceae bacterium]